MLHCGDCFGRHILIYSLFHPYIVVRNGLSPCSLMYLCNLSDAFVKLLTSIVNGYSGITFMSKWDIKWTACVRFQRFA